MNKKGENVGLRSGNALVGGLFIVLGTLFFLGELFNIRISHFMWPFFVIVPGMMLFIAALAYEEDKGQTLASVGGLVTMVGLILLYQNSFDHWASWSYAWALVAPTSLGLGLLCYGWLKNSVQLRQRGWHMAKVGLGIFVAAAVFFEFVIGISGFGLGHLGWPILLIVLGFFLLVRNLNVSWHKA